MSLQSITLHARLLKQQGRLPAHAFRVGLQLFQSPILNLANAFFRNTKQVADLAQTVSAVASQSKAEVKNLALAGVAPAAGADDCLRPGRGDGNAAASLADHGERALERPQKGEGEGGSKRLCE